MANWEVSATLAASAAQATNGTSAVVDLGTRDRLLRQVLTVTAAATSLVVRLECSADGVAGWRTFGTFSAAAAVGAERASFVSPERYVRVGWIVTGSFTFSVTGTKGVSFANLEQLYKFGIPSSALGSINDSSKAESLAATTELASGILAIRFDPPIVSQSVDLAQAVCKIAAYDLLSVRGFNPDGDDSNYRRRYEDAMAWLKAVADGKITPVDIIDDTPEEDDGYGAEVTALSIRPWRC